MTMTIIAIRAAIVSMSKGQNITVRFAMTVLGDANINVYIAIQRTLRREINCLIFIAMVAEKVG